MEPYENLIFTKGDRHALFSPERIQERVLRKAETTENSKRETKARSINMPFLFSLWYKLRTIPGAMRLW